MTESQAICISESITLKYLYYLGTYPDVSDCLVSTTEIYSLQNIELFIYYIFVWPSSVCRCVKYIFMFAASQKFNLATCPVSQESKNLK